MPHVPPSVTPLLEALLAGVREALADNLLGLYLRGSLALGGFDPATSDVDILVVTHSPLSEPEFTALASLHVRVPAGDNEYGHDYDLCYLDRDLLRRHTSGRRYAKVGPGEPLQYEDHRPNWVLERRTVREHGITIAGPDPRTLIDPVSPDDIRRAVRGELRYRLGAWTEPLWPLDDLRRRGTQAFEVETVCRALFTLQTGELCTKDAALDWAVSAVPDRWHDLIRWARRIRGDVTKDDTRAEDALSFLSWAVSQVSDKRNPG